MLPPKTLWKNASLPFHRFFWLPAILDIPGLVAASLHLCFHLHMLFSPLRVSSFCLWVQISLFGWGHQSVDLGLTLIQYEFILPKIHYEKTVFPNKITFTGQGSGLQYLLGGHNSIIIQTVPVFISHVSFLTSRLWRTCLSGALLQSRWPGSLHNPPYKPVNLIY